jgi:hypothetical protein
MGSASAFEALCALLEQEGIDAKPLLESPLQSRLATDGKGWFYSDSVDVDPRDVSGWIEHLRHRSSDFFACGFSGSGLSSVVFSLVIRQGLTMAMFEVAWGVFEEADRRSARASALIGLTNSLLEEAAINLQSGRLPASTSLIAVESDLADLEAWAWISQKAEEIPADRIVWHDGGLFAAIQALWALGPDPIGDGSGPGASS